MESVETLNRLFLTQPPREAYFRILKSAGEGSARANLLLGLYFIDGYNTFFMDEGLGQKYLEAAYRGGDLPGSVILAKRTPYRDFVTISAAQLQSIQDMANEGDFLAQFALGWMYFAGKWVPNSEELAIEWFRKSAEQGFANAQRWVGSRLTNYRHTDPDWRNKRVEWYKRAAYKGQIEAQLFLAQEYRLPPYKCHCPELAHYWYKKAAEQGCGFAYARLADELKNSADPEGIQKRMALYQKGALLGSSACRARMEMTISFSWKEVELYHQVLTFLQSR